MFGVCTYVQTYRTTNQVVTERREKFYYMQQNLHIFRILPDEGKLVEQQVT